MDIKIILIIITVLILVFLIIGLKSFLKGAGILGDNLAIKNKNTDVERFNYNPEIEADKEWTAVDKNVRSKHDFWYMTNFDLDYYNEHKHMNKYKHPSPHGDWKIHISPKPRICGEVLKICQEVCDKIADYIDTYTGYDDSFNIRGDSLKDYVLDYKYRKHLASYQTYENSQTGKYFVIYPITWEHARLICDVLHQIFKQKGYGEDDFIHVIYDFKVYTGIYTRLADYNEGMSPVVEDEVAACRTAIALPMTCLLAHCYDVKNLDLLSIEHPFKSLKVCEDIEVPKQVIKINPFIRTIVALNEIGKEFNTFDELKSYVIDNESFNSLRKCVNDKIVEDYGLANLYEIIKSANYLNYYSINDTYTSFTGLEKPYTTYLSNKYKCIVSERVRLIIYRSHSYYSKIMKEYDIRRKLSDKEKAVAKEVALYIGKETTQLYQYYLYGETLDLNKDDAANKIKEILRSTVFEKDNDFIHERIDDCNFIYEIMGRIRSQNVLSIEFPKIIDDYYNF